MYICLRSGSFDEGVGFSFIMGSWSFTNTGDGSCHFGSNFLYHTYNSMQSWLIFPQNLVTNFLISIGLQSELVPNTLRKLTALHSGNKRVVYDFGPDATEFPDGMTIDSSGNLWIACYGIGQIVNIDATTGRNFLLLAYSYFIEPTCANCTVGSYSSLSVCPTVCHWTRIQTR